MTTTEGRTMPVDAQLALVAESLLTLPYETWNFGDSVAFEALLTASDVLDDPRYAAFAHGWMRSWATRATPYRRLDCTAPGLAMVRAAERFGDGRLLSAATSLADYLLERPRLGGVFATWDHSPLMHPYGPAQLHGRFAAMVADPPPGVFVDCLHFDPPYLLALGAATGNSAYWREGLEQATGYVRLLQAESGLFDHFVLDGEPGTFGPGWGRGQGWALLGLLDVIETAERLDLDDAAATAVADLGAAANALVGAMTELQGPDGHWAAVVTDPGSGRESSTAAFMGDGFARAIRAGVVPVERRAPVLTAIEMAVAATRSALSAAGTLTDVSAAVMACTEPTHYSHVPRGFLVPWGQGPALLALAATT
jgi:unsaturated rhamnogalacturonyl hydrolase